jgi:hypothetical protein
MVRSVELAVDPELRRGREVEQRQELGHEMHLAAALEDVHILLGGDHRIAVEIGRALLELREVLDALERALRAEQPLDVHPAQRRRIDPVPELLRADVSDEVVEAFVWPFAWQSRHATPRLGRSERRSSVWLNCCCGKGVSSRRSPSSCFGLRTPLNSA